jgi:hypothetical protein
MENTTGQKQFSTMYIDDECYNKNLKTMLTRFDKVLPQIYFASIKLGHDYIDGTTYLDEDNPHEYNNVYCKCIAGSSMRFNFPYGTVQFHIKNSILYEYIGYKFIINEVIIPFTMMPNTFGTTDEERIEKSKVKVKRSNGKIQNALIDFTQGFEIQKEKNRIMVKLLFYPDEKEQDEPIHYTITNYSPNNNRINIDHTYPNEVLNKYVSLSDFLEVNPDFKFIVDVPNPHEEYKNIYDDYIAGNASMENMYESLNLYYKFKLQDYFQSVHDIFTRETKHAFQYNIYSS